MTTACNHARPSYCVIVFACLLSGVPQTQAQQPPAETTEARDAGPAAVLEFERSFRDPEDYRNSKPIRLADCQNITELTADLWSKKHVLTDFKKHRTAEQVGAIVIVKTEFCCDGTRLCAVTTACLEKRSTPLIDRFRVYGGWIEDENPDHPVEEWKSWDEAVINEYDFVQGPGARIVVMVPTWDGKMYQWQSTATDLELDDEHLDAAEGHTPKLETFLAEALEFAPQQVPETDLSQN